MTQALEQHQREIESNVPSWETKPLLQSIYRAFYEKILGAIDRNLPGRVVEIGSGIGNLKQSLPGALATDLFPNAWLDLVCDAYALPFAAGTVSHLILFDVFHHLEAPALFLEQARRVLPPHGRVILFEPYISAISRVAYGCFHHEPIAWRAPIDLDESRPRPRRYYAAQGNASRLFFARGARPLPFRGWRIHSREAFAAFTYLLSGGFSKPALYPARLLPLLDRFDRFVSRFPRLTGARCMVVLVKTAG